MLKLHMAAFGCGFVLDMLLGDPYFLPHPIRLMGALIGTLEKKMNRGAHPCLMGAFMTALVLGAVGMTAFGVLAGAFFLHPVLGFLTESVMTYQILATKCLKTESMKVCRKLEQGDLEGARRAVSMIVGRDTQKLDQAGIIRAAVETVAENTSDGAIAPMLYLALGGPVLGFLYKAVNTMDSMVGYKNERYLLFGKAAARLDDAVNFLPARISAFLMLFASLIGGKDFDAGRAWRIFCRDRYHHASPNSAQTEAVCAGALGVRLAGPASYFGREVTKPWIGDQTRPVEIRDIRRANRLLYLTAWSCELLCLMGMGVWLW